MSRRRHAPDPASRRQVEVLVGFGMPEDGVARMLGVDAKTLQKRYPEELAMGEFKANARVAENLYRRATGEGRESVIAAIFWLKARAGWKETSTHEVGGHNGQPLKIVLSAVDALL